jgi:glycosyltransferase involved in cell wall biosynthesis
MLVNVTLPVFNEEAQLAHSVGRLCNYLAAWNLVEYEVLIVNNGSTDETGSIADDLRWRFSSVHALHLPQRGRGGALKAAWNWSAAGVVSYMDIDLSTDLACLRDLLPPLMANDCDLAIGSRLLRPATTERGRKREWLSRLYNRFLQHLLDVRFSDAQCGFKGLRKSAADDLLPRIENNHWFFDTELLVLAQRFGYRIHDFPVIWRDDPDSRVALLRTGIEHLLGAIRLKRRWRSQGWIRSRRTDSASNQALPSMPRNSHTICTSPKGSSTENS